MTVNLVRFKKDGKPLTFSLPNGCTLIGRSSQCQLRIPVLTVSKKHCQIDVDDDNVEINDLGSRNGTFVNKVPILEPQAVGPGTVLQVGPVQFLFQINGKPDLKKKGAAEPQKSEKSEAKAQDSGKAEAVAKPESQQPDESKEEELDIDSELDFLDEDLSSFEEDKDPMESNK